MERRMLPESRVPHLAGRAIGEARRLRLAAADTAPSSNPPAAPTAVSGTSGLAPTAPPDPLALARPPESLAFPVEWQLEDP